MISQLLLSIATHKEIEHRRQELLARESDQNLRQVNLTLQQTRSQVWNLSIDSRAKDLCVSVQSRTYMYQVVRTINHKVDTLSVNAISSTPCEVDSQLGLSLPSLQLESSWKILPIKKLTSKKIQWYWSMQPKSSPKKVFQAIYTQWVLDLVRADIPQGREKP